jgi:hypothetical protein
MTITMRDFENLDVDSVTAALNEVVVRVQEDNPSLDVTRGVFHDTIAYYHAVLSAQRDANTQDYLNARSLKQINADPSLADPDIVDDVLSNFRVVRKEGALATGEVAVVRDNNLTLTLSLGHRFTADGLGYVTTDVYTAKAEESQVTGDTDRLITLLSDGNYVFTVPVVAEEEGLAYELKRETLVIPDVLPTGYVTSYASSDITGGLDIETNQAMLERLQQGIAARTLSNRVNMAAMLREIDEFSRVVSMSIVGYGDEEMSRDRHWIWPTSGGGRVDWYIRSVEQFVREGLTKEASLVSKNDDTTGVWQLTFTRDEAPAFYEIGSIRQTDDNVSAGSYAILSDVRNVDLTDDFTPDIVSGIEGAYTAYQTVVVTFTDTDTDVTDLEVGDKRDYAVEVKLLPLIADIQDTVCSRDVRHYGADCLIKAPVPCFVDLSFTIRKRQGQADPDTDAIKTALCATVNRGGFSGELYASGLYDVVHNYLEEGQTVGALDIFGRIRTPAGDNLYVRSGVAVSVPHLPAEGVTRRTVQFFLETGTITIAVETVAAIEA